jgi:hypothetical protein
VGEVVDCDVRGLRHFVSLFEQLVGSRVEHLVEVEELLNELDLLLLAHLLDFGALEVRLEVVGRLEPARVRHHGLADHLTAFELLLHGCVVVLQTVLSQLPLHLDLPQGFS